MTNNKNNLNCGKEFNISMFQELKKAEKYLWRMYGKHDKVKVTTTGNDKIAISKG